MKIPPREKVVVRWYSALEQRRAIGHSSCGIPINLITTVVIALIISGVSLLGMGATLLVAVDNEAEAQMNIRAAEHSRLNLGKLK